MEYQQLRKRMNGKSIIHVIELRFSLILIGLFRHEWRNEVRSRGLCRLCNWIKYKGLRLQARCNIFIFPFLTCKGRLSIDKSLHGQKIRTSLALRDRKRLLFWPEHPSSVPAIHVLPRRLCYFDFQEWLSLQLELNLLNYKFFHIELDSGWY